MRVLEKNRNLMRLTAMNRSLTRSLFATALLVTASLPALAQNAVPPGKGNSFRDTSMVKPPAGAKVAIYEFEDLECPACAHAAPIVHAAIEKYKIPLVRHDFPLKMHVWSFDAAITARYLQDKVSPKVAEDFRRDVFASQTAIASKDDLENFTRRWFQQHGQNMPFVMDPNGLFRAEVQADETLGERIGLSQTPTIFVVTTKGWTQIMDPNYLYQTIDQALAQAGPAPVTKPAAKAAAKKQSGM
jgi:protein-disulfide isomerase